MTIRDFRTWLRNRPAKLAGAAALLVACTLPASPGQGAETVSGFGPSPAVMAMRSVRETEHRQLSPGRQVYRDTADALADFRSRLRDGGWRKIPDNKALREGDEDEAVGTLRQRLVDEGDLATGHTSNATYFDEALEAAVRSFQRRHGLKPDGIVGKNTFYALNTPLQDRIDQLALNLSRDTTPASLTQSDRIRVNVAAQTLDYIIDGRTVWRTRVVVGKPSNPTPIFDDEIEYIVINPYWNIPSSIAVNEMLPKLRRDPGSLAREGIFIKSGWGRNAVRINPWLVDWWRVSADDFPFHLQQEPGRRNALGRIKFMFPNRHNVYLHDTPAKHLFNRAQRAFSHGCVRVYKPHKLAALLLRHQGWSKGRIKRAMASGRRIVVKLRKPVAINIHYTTAWVDERGAVQFRNDIYGRDRRQLMAGEPATVN